MEILPTFVSVPTNSRADYGCFGRQTSDWCELSTRTKPGTALPANLERSGNAPIIRNGYRRAAREKGHDGAAEEICDRVWRGRRVCGADGCPRPCARAIL